jgi:PKD domain
MRQVLCSLGLAAGLVSIVSMTTSACTIDGKPSAFANNIRAVLYQHAPTPATYAWWARFAFPRAFRVGQHIAFHENDAQVRPLLPLADLKRSWRWEFGDKTAQVGDRVTHRYQHPGKYRVSVDAYFPKYGWEAFDSITITIQRD